MTWDGKNESGSLLANGNYQFSVLASAGDKNLM